MFYSIIPKFYFFFNQAQTRGIESSQIQAAVEQFEQQIICIRDLIDNLGLKINNPRQRDKNNSLGKSSKCYCQRSL